MPAVPSTPPRMKSVSFKPRLSNSGITVPPEIFQKLEPESPKRAKKVNFDSTVHVVLIPSRDEYTEANLSKSIWYSSRELQDIEKSAYLKISTGKLFDESDDFWKFLPHI